MKNDGRTMPEGDTWEDDPSDPEVPEVMVRCLACNELVVADWFDVHVIEDCDGMPLYE